jgi:glutamate 5-kinase
LNEKLFVAANRLLFAILRTVMSTGERNPLRVVVKIGSAVLARAGVLDVSSVQRIAGDICDTLDADKDRRVLVVSSGAVASGFRSLGLAVPPKQIVQKQAAAAVGQPRLMSAWAEAFGKRAGHDGAPRSVAQVLLTAEDIDHRTRFLNARRTLDALLEAGVTPIINENDSVSFAEIKLGDNDHLSSLVASLVNADLLIVLSTVGGVWDASAVSKSKRGEPVIVPEIRSLNEGLSHVQASTSDVGTGGMATKIRAACGAASLGIETVIADGGLEGVVCRVVNGEAIGTRFPAAASARSTAHRKRWIGFSARPKGTLQVDDGAKQAVATRGASLLPSGLVDVHGTFARGTLVELMGPDRVVFARGLSGYGSEELRALRGKKSAEIEATLGYLYSKEVIHRDDLALVGSHEHGACR